jgi:hypothetical protein
MSQLETLKSLIRSVQEWPLSIAERTLGVRTSKPNMQRVPTLWATNQRNSLTTLPTYVVNTCLTGKRGSPLMRF